MFPAFRFIVALLILFSAPSLLFAANSMVAPLASHALLLDAAVSGRNIIAVGQRGTVIVSEDQGQSWKQAIIPTNILLTSLCARGSKVWVVGHDSTILHSPDSGETWSLQYSSVKNDEPLLDVLFLDDSVGFAIGAYGLFLKTNDGGMTWEQSYISEDDFHLNAITKSDDEILYIAGESGSIYRSEDMGTTWETLLSPYGGSFFGVLTTSYDSVYVFGMRGNLFVSYDNGDAWTKIDSGTTATFQGGRVLADDRLLLVGLSGAAGFVDGEIAEMYRIMAGKSISTVLEMPDDKVMLFGVFGASSPFSLFDLSRGGK